MIQKIRFLVLSFCFLSIASHAELIRYEVSPNVTVIGKPITVTFESSEPIQDHLEDIDFSPFELIDTNSNGTVHQVQLRIFKLDEQQIPSFNIRSGSKWITVPAKSIQIVREHPSNEIADIITGIPIEKPWKTWGLITLLGLGLLAIAIQLLKKRSKHHKKVSDHLKNSQQNAADICIRKLKQLDSKKLDTPKHFQAISLIFREYLEKTENINALELTTTELMAHLKNSPYNPEQLKRFQHILTTCDTIKFFKMEQIDKNFISTSVIPFLNSLKEGQS